jgi:hypothetical protein
VVVDADVGAEPAGGWEQRGAVGAGVKPRAGAATGAASCTAPPLPSAPATPATGGGQRAVRSGLRPPPPGAGTRLYVASMSNWSMNARSFRWL